MTNENKSRLIKFLWNLASAILAAVGTALGVSCAVAFFVYTLLNMANLIPFTKRFEYSENLVNLLESRGLQICDRNKAIQYLDKQYYNSDSLHKNNKEYYIQLYSV